jgi:septation ring formation regulator EzrA
MPEITNELIYEVLKAIQADIAELKERVTSIEPTQLAMRSHLAGLVTSDLDRDADLAALRARVERIERRLELRD